MKAAANLTGVQVTFPNKPFWHQRFVDAFEKFGSDQGSVHPNRGSALAWLAHIDMLKFVIQSGFNSALILEDDVDWDVAIKASHCRCTTPSFLSMH